MDQTTIQTILEGGILATLVWIGSSTATIAKNSGTKGGNEGGGSQGGNEGGKGGHPNG